MVSMVFHQHSKQYLCNLAYPSFLWLKDSLHGFQPCWCHASIGICCHWLKWFFFTISAGLGLFWTGRYRWLMVMLNLFCFTGISAGLGLFGLVGMDGKWFCINKSTIRTNLGCLSRVPAVFYLSVSSGTIFLFQGV